MESPLRRWVTTLIPVIPALSGEGEAEIPAGMVEAIKADDSEWLLRWIAIELDRASDERLVFWQQWPELGRKQAEFERLWHEERQAAAEAILTPDLKWYMDSMAEFGGRIARLEHARRLARDVAGVEHLPVRGRDY
jgi:hypothetical protein